MTLTLTRRRHEAHNALSGYTRVVRLYARGASGGGATVASEVAVRRFRDGAPGVIRASQNHHLGHLHCGAGARRPPHGPSLVVCDLCDPGRGSAHGVRGLSSGCDGPVDDGRAQLTTYNPRPRPGPTDAPTGLLSAATRRGLAARTSAPGACPQAPARAGLPHHDMARAVLITARAGKKEGKETRGEATQKSSPIYEQAERPCCWCCWCCSA